MFVMPRKQPLWVELNCQQKRQKMPARRPEFQPFNYSIYTNGRYPQRFSHFFDSLVMRTIDTEGCRPGRFSKE